MGSGLQTFKHGLAHRIKAHAPVFTGSFFGADHSAKVPVRNVKPASAGDMKFPCQNCFMLMQFGNNELRFGHDSKKSI